MTVQILLLHAASDTYIYSPLQQQSYICTASIKEMWALSDAGSMQTFQGTPLCDVNVGSSTIQYVVCQ